MSREAVIDPSSRSTPGNRSLLRRLNTYGVLNRVRQNPHTLSALSAATGLSRTAIESVVGDLIHLGWVEAGVEGNAPTSPGRPATKYRFRQDAGVVATIDVGAHHVYSVVADLAGRTLAVDRRSVPETLASHMRLSVARHSLESALAEAGVELDNLWVLTIGSPGVVNAGVVTYFGGSGMPGWIGLNVEAEFAKYVECPVLVEGDCALGAVAEQWIGVSQGVASVVYVLSGIRTGAAIITDGHLQRGSRGGAGLVGELAELRWRELELELYGGNVYGSDRPSRADIFERARAGDAKAVDAVQDFADALALGAAAMVLAVDPQLVVIGGSSSTDWDLYLDSFTRKLISRCPLVPEIKISTLGFESVAVGGIRVGMDYIDSLLRQSIESGHAFPEAQRKILRS